MGITKGEVRLIDGWPCLITGGYYLDPMFHRVSNHFSWQKIRESGYLDSEEFTGYGGDWPLIENAKIIPRVNIPMDDWFDILAALKKKAKKKKPKKKK